MRKPSAAAVSFIAVGCWSLFQQEPVLSASSLYDLHDSADRVKWVLQLSKDEFAALENALDVLVGDEARELVETIDASIEPVPPAERLASEAKVLAPIGGMTYEGLVTAALDKTVDRRTGLLGDLRVEKVAAPKSRRQLNKIDVVSAEYWTSVSTGERSIDFSIRNGSDQTIESLLLDCRLIDPNRLATRERGTCRVGFEGGLAPGMAATVKASVNWESRQRLGWIVEARPVRAYGASGQALWEVPSQLDPREAGRMASLETRIAALDDDLESLRVDRVGLR